MPGDDDERAIETQRLVQELAEVRKRMQMRAEQPPLRSNGSGAYRAVTPLPFLASKAIAEARGASEPSKDDKGADTPDAKDAKDAKEKDKDKDEPPPTRRGPA